MYCERIETSCPYLEFLLYAKNHSDLVVRDADLDSDDDLTRAAVAHFQGTVASEMLDLAQAGCAETCGVMKVLIMNSIKTEARSRFAKTTESDVDDVNGSGD